jgi:hypothetical protein
MTVTSSFSPVSSAYLEGAKYGWDFAGQTPLAIEQRIRQRLGELGTTSQTTFGSEYARGFRAVCRDSEAGLDWAAEIEIPDDFSDDSNHPAADIAALAAWNDYFCNPASSCPPEQVIANHLLAAGKSDDPVYVMRFTEAYLAELPDIDEARDFRDQAEHDELRWDREHMPDSLFVLI